MVRANGREGVVPANRDPADTLSVGADKAPMGVDSGGLFLVFSLRLLLRSNVRGSVALCRRAADRALRRLFPALWNFEGESQQWRKSEGLYANLDARPVETRIAVIINLIPSGARGFVSDFNDVIQITRGCQALR